MIEQYNTELIGLVTELSKLIPQLHGFISNFNETITQYGINVITEGSGQLSVDVPSDMTEIDAEKCVKKIRILDRLIHDRLDNINNIFKKGYGIENNLKKLNNEHISVLTDKSKILTKLKNSYKH
jgi:hypothetical protein